MRHSKTLAEALVTALAFLELSDDSAVDPDAAVRVMEDIVAVLAEASATEKRALLEVAEQRRREALARGASEDVVAFYASFGSSFGLLDEDEDE